MPPKFDTSTVAPSVVGQGWVYTKWRRVAAVVTAALSVTGMLLTFWLVLVSDDPPVTPPILFRLVAVLVIIPGAAAWWIRRLSLARIEIDGVTIALSTEKFRLEVPCNAIVDVRPWTLPLPGPGISLHMRSGRKLGYEIELAEPSSVLETLATKGDVTSAAVAGGHPTIRYAAAKAGPHGWIGPLLKFVVFALLPAGVLFNAHQHIAYGGSLGEYYMMGAAAYVRTFVVYWATTATYLVLYATVWRVPAELAALAAAWVIPRSTTNLRKLVDIVCGIAYYAGVPVLLLLRFLA